MPDLMPAAAPPRPARPAAVTPRPGVPRRKVDAGEAPRGRPPPGGLAASVLPAPSGSPQDPRRVSSASPFRAPLDDSNAAYGGAPKLDAGVWHRILTHVRRTHPSLNRTWFETLVPRQLANGVVHVCCDTVAQLNFLTGQCQQPFTAATQAVTNRLSVVMFHSEQLRPGGVFDDREQQLPLSPDYTFENFVVGPGNQLAHAASLNVAERPNTDYNPYFIHGGVGLGKTHLLQAVCQKRLELQPTARILYLSCDSFINQFMNAVEAGDMNTFRYKFRSADVLVVDDIHFFAGRERTQEEFFHTFNTLRDSGKQIILSSDAPPNDIPDMEKRLVSRFNMGMVAEIEPPCYETRVAILRKKARMRGLDLGDDVICYLAARIDTNTRELEGGITRVQGESLLHNGVIDLAIAKKALGDNGEPVPERRITIQHLLDATTHYFGMKVSDLQGKKRTKSVVFPRQVCMYLARKHTRYSLAEIGGYFGGRDHTTVLHAVRVITAQMGDSDVQRQVIAVENRLTAGLGGGRNDGPSNGQSGLSNHAA